MKENGVEEMTKQLRCEIFNQDCIRGMAEQLQPDSIDLCVASIPFEQLFVYSNKPEDLGNNGSTLNIRSGRFALNLRFFIEQLYRVMKPGTNACIHIQQLLSYKNQHAVIGRRDFRGSVIDLFLAGGWTFFGEFAIAKNPQAMAQRLNLHCLQFKTGYGRNSVNLAPAPNDYVLIFQKPGNCPHTVRCLFNHDKNPEGWVTSEEWIKWACGIWDDIDEMDVLDGAKQRGKEEPEEKHVCPLQLEVIRRLVMLYTNPNERQPGVTVLDPFVGIGSTAYVALTNGRNAVGFELKDSYYREALRNVEKAKRRVSGDDGMTGNLFPAAAGAGAP